MCLRRRQILSVGEYNCLDKSKQKVQPICWSSYETKCYTCLVLRPGSMASVDDFDIACTIKLQIICKQVIPTSLLTDRLCFLDVLTCMSSMTKNRLKPYLQSVQVCWNEDNGLGVYTFWILHAWFIEKDKTTLRPKHRFSKMSVRLFNSIMGYLRRNTSRFSC